MPCRVITSSFSMLQLLSVSMNASSHKDVASDSIICRMAELGRKVTRAFHDWLAICPGLALDCFLSMDKTTCNSYAHTLHMKGTVLKEEADAEGGEDDGASGEDAVLNQIDERRAILEAENADLTSDSDILDILDNDLIPRESRRKSKTKKSRKTAPRERRPRPPRVHEEDVDVDDLDALNIGAADDENESEGPTAMEKIGCR